jgi:hypothetical protein
MITRQLHAQHRRLSDGGVRTHRHGQQIKARLIYPNNGPLFLGGLFLSAGQIALCQVAIACSSRSRRPFEGRLSAQADRPQEATDMGGMIADSQPVRSMTSATRLVVQTWPRYP